MAKRSMKTNNVASAHVAPKVIDALSELTDKRDMVAVGPVKLYLEAGRDTILGWPSLEDEKDRNRRGGEVDWFRAEIDRTQWAKHIEEYIESLKARPKSVVTDREMQTLRQRLSYAATVLRRTRGMASKIVEAESYGFTVSLAERDALSRTTYPITVIDEKRKGLPIQLGVTDFLSLRLVKGKLATELELRGARRQAGQKSTNVKALLGKQPEAKRVADLLGQMADYIKNNAPILARDKSVMHEVQQLHIASGNVMKQQQRLAA